MLKNTIITLAAVAALAFTATPAVADRGVYYEVTITNITQGQTFTPLLLATHKPSVGLFEVGDKAGVELEMLAESGATGPLAEALKNAGRAVGDIEEGDSLLVPGDSITFKLRGDPRRQFLSLAAMLIPTNDTFVALDTVRLPWRGSTRYYARAYDAGTEANDQSCANMPGPRCGGEGYSPVPGPGDEGFVHVGNGFHELGNEDADGFEVLGPATYDWRNPVAKVTIVAKRGHQRGDDRGDN